jgi:Tol biopolymer transport system component
MKKLLIGAITLSTFSISLLLFQISCQKEVIAQNPTTVQQGKIIFAQKAIYDSLKEIWIVNYDGTGQTKLPLPVLPQGFNFRSIGISPDGQTVFIAGYDNNGNKSQIYSMTSTGTNFKKIVDYDGFPSLSGSIIDDMQAY